MHDYVIKNVDVIDGTARPRRRANVAIDGGRFSYVGPDSISGKEEVDGTGLVASPGFVDVHTHLDAQLDWDPTGSPSLLHGTTTVVGGNCGFTLAPLAPRDAPYLVRMMAAVEGMSVEALEAGLDWQWSSFGDWIDRFAGRLAVNAGFLVGHSAVRLAVMGPDAVGSEADDQQIREMERLVAEALGQGALGFSSSRSPGHKDGDGNVVPSGWATRDEFVRLSAVLRGSRATALEFIPTVGAFDDEAVDLMVAMSVAADRPLNWNLLNLDAANPALHESQLRASAAARRAGGRVVALSYPGPMRLRLNFIHGSSLRALPGWDALFTVDLATRRRMLEDPETRQRLKEDAARPGADPLDMRSNWPAMRIVETFSPENQGLAGRTFGEIAAERGADPFDTLVDVVLRDDLRTGFLSPDRADDDATWELRRQAWGEEDVVIGGSDAGAHMDMMCGATWTTRLLATAVREKQVLTLEEAVHQVTDVPARLYGLVGRGRIREGGYADLVLFDPDRIGPEPLRTVADLPAGKERLVGGAIGIDRVLVNGTEVVRDNRGTGAVPGALLRSTDAHSVSGGVS